MKKIIDTKRNIEAIVDDEFYNEISKYKWRIFDSQNHFKSSSDKIILKDGTYSNKCVLLHRFIWYLANGDITNGMQIDHIDHNPLNNQLSNLRLATIRQNVQNKVKRKDNTSGLIAVTKLQKKNGKIYWRMRIQSINRKNANGLYAEECYYFPYTAEGKSQAGHFFDSLKVLYTGEFCGELNFPDELIILDSIDASNKDKKLEFINKYKKIRNLC